MQFKTNLSLSQEQIKKVKTEVEKQHGTLDDLEYIEVLPIEDEEESITVRYKVKNVPKIERIRRITGYLVGSLDRWNDAKRAEESERVKHA